MSNADYHADFSAVSCSMLKVFAESRREYEARYITRTIVSPPPSDSMQLGSLAHAMLLEPSAMVEFVPIPDAVLAVDKNGVKSRKGKAWDAFEAANANKTLLKIDEYNAAQQMIDAVRAKCGPWFASPNGKAEHEIRWTDEATGLPCKAKIDYLMPGFIFDFKTAKSSTPKSFRSSVRNFQYDLQESHYTAGVKAVTGIDPRFLFVVVKSEPPHQCRVYETPENDNAPPWSRIDKETARMNYRQALRELAACYASGDWSDPHEDEIFTLYHEDCQ